MVSQFQIDLYMNPLEFKSAATCQKPGPTNIYNPERSLRVLVFKDSEDRVRAPPAHAAGSAATEPSPRRSPRGAEGSARLNQGFHFSPHSAFSRHAGREGRRAGTASPAGPCGRGAEPGRRGSPQAAPARRRPVPPRPAVPGGSAPSAGRPPPPPVRAPAPPPAERV